MRISYEDSWDEDSWEVLTHGLKLLMDENRNSLYFFHQTLFSYIGEKLHDFWYLLLLDLI